jgi:glycosyltransferase involved in cell wall biosynthesis
MLPFLKRFKNVCITVHDPVPHSGEDSWKVSLPRAFFFNIPGKKRYLFYSHFAKKQFEDHYKKIRHPKMVLHLNPYGFLRHLINEGDNKKKHILFFGRLSPYKGVDDLLKAMPSVFKEFPNEQLIIAGKRFAGFEIDQDMLNRYKNNITLIEKHIPNEELATLIQDAKFIVCPYKDATQSGVLMTAFGLKTPVIATNVGSFPEFIEDDVNGLLVPADDPEKLADSIRYALRNDHYKTLEQNISNNDVEGQWSRNADILLHAYAS